MYRPGTEARIMRRKLSPVRTSLVAGMRWPQSAALCLCVGFTALSANAAPSVAASGDDYTRAADRSIDRATAVEPPSETDLMMQALTAERGESPNAAKIERISAQVRAESKLKRVIVTSVWKDPFAEDPDRPIVVRMLAPRVEKTQKKDRGGELTAMRRQLARARAETAVAQADAAAAQAEAARAKANIARAEAVAARVQAKAARQEAVAARAECVESGRGRRAARARDPEDRDGLGRFAVSARAPALSGNHRGLASKARIGRSTRRKTSASDGGPAGDDGPVPPASVEALQASPAGIVVVPIGR